MKGRVLYDMMYLSVSDQNFNLLLNMDDQRSIFYRKRGSASYIVREVRSVRERDREREKEREGDGSDVTLVALKLAMHMSFALFLAKKIAP